LISVSFGVLFLVSRSKGLYMNALVFLVLIVGLAALGWLVWSYMQQNAKLLETRTVEIAGGLRFEAHAFSVEMHQTDKCVKVSAQPGTMQVKALQEDGTEHNQNGVSTLSLPAAGLSVAVVRTTVASDGRSAAQAMNTYDIVFNTNGGLHVSPAAVGRTTAQVVRLQGLPAPVAQSFQAFASRLSIWADKVTKFAEQDKAQALQAAQDAATAALEAQAKAEAEAAQTASAEEETGSLDLAGQIAKWRKTAGFSGQYSEVSTHNKGGINWFIDLVPDGRITLHGHKRTVFTTLHGATITALPKAIEVGVRDEYWSDGDPLMVFQVLEGSPPNERRQWQEWLEAARNRADVSARKGY
jgi:hypothetical protein